MGKRKRQIMNEYDVEAMEAADDRGAEQYDIDKDRGLLEALELADIVRKQMEVINHAG
jgi:hypothetical protein